MPLKNSRLTCGERYAYFGDRTPVCIAHQPGNFPVGLFTRFFKILFSIAAHRPDPVLENLRCAACGIVALVAFTLGSADAQTVLHAGPDKVSLVELYTSEGCSSCPPAESWLSALNHDSRLWKTIVPVAFHVDYWDDLGWKDRFSKRAYTLRQRSYSIAWGTSSVYTPEFIINGKEWKGWFAGETLSDQVEHAAGRLDAKVENGTATVTFSGNSNENTLDAHLAPLAMDISSEVRAGENRGRKLSHSFVALDLVTVRMTGNNGIFTAELPLKASADVAALAVWVTPAGSLKPLQAAGGVIR